MDFLINSKRLRKRSLRLVFVSLVALATLSSLLYAQSNTDPQNDGSRYAWGENIGWIDFRPAQGPGVTVADAVVTGSAWGENVGWINLSPPNGNGGVTNDGTGRLAGYAWGENIGWINFAPQGGGVFINACGEFHGAAWGENVGWIRFRSDGAVPFKVTTSWVSPIDTVPPTTAASSMDGNLAGWNDADVTVELAAGDCGHGVETIHYRLDGGPETVAQGSSAAVMVTTDGDHALTFYAVDTDGNAEAPQEIRVRVDKTPPVIALVAPVDGQQFFVHQSANASYSATDATSGVAMVTGTVPSGSPLDTSVFGPQSFGVSAMDLAGNYSQLAVAYSVVFPGNIDSGNTGAHFAWGENVGWINLRPSHGPGVTVIDTAVTGYAWGENVGWINFSPTNGSGGVTNDTAGNLAGYAWGENVGWISFSCSNTSSCSRVAYGVTVNPTTGQFNGHAWGENIGWIRFGSAGPVAFGVETAWRAPDATAPSITPSVTGTLGSNGWYVGDVGVSWVVTDNESPVSSSSGCETSQVTTDTAGVTFTCSATSLGGTASQSVIIKRDATPPTVTAAASPSPNADGWNNTDVMVAFSGSDSLSGIDSCSAPATLGEGAGQSASGTCSDLAGNSASTTAGGINVDHTPPTITFTGQTPGANGAGWNNTDVTLTWSCADVLSGPTATGDSKTVTAEGSGQSATGACSDKAGNSATDSRSGVNIDKTAPTITITTPPSGAVYALNAEVSASYSCSDTLAMISTCAGPVANGSNINTSSIGPKSFVVNAVDQAGNSASATHNYSVQYSFVGFLQPIENLPVLNQATGGRTIPVKWQLLGVDGAYVSDLSSFVSLMSAPVACGAAPSDVVEEQLTAPGDTTVRYDLAANQFIFNWKTTKGWTGCRLLQLTLADGTQHYAKFNFK